MSSIISSLGPALAPAASAVSQTQSTGAAARGAEGSAASSTAQAQLTSQSGAFVLSLSSEAKLRPTSSGEGRKVDGSLSKDDSKSARSKKEDNGEGNSSPRTLNVTA